MSIDTNRFLEWIFDKFGTTQQEMCFNLLQVESIQKPLVPILKLLVRFLQDHNYTQAAQIAVNTPEVKLHAC